MKNLNKYLTLVIGLLIVSTVFAQAPEKMNYQAVARDLSGIPLVSTAVNLQFDILQGSSTGAVAYSETQSKTTNQFGLFTAEIGAGAVVSGSFPAITWGANSYFLRITVNGDVMPATQLLSVPYALYSKTSGGAGASLTAGSGIDITGGVITATSDTSSTNEFQTLSLNATADTLFLTNGGFVIIPPSAGDNWGSDSVNVLGNNIIGNGTVANPISVIDNDTSMINELQNLSWNTTDSNIIDISNGIGIPLASNAPTLNQVLTWNGANWTAQTVNGGWTKGTGNDIFNNTDSVGIGTTDPRSLLQLGDFMHFFPLNIGGTEEYAVSTYNAYWDGTVVRNTTGGTSGISILGHDSGNPVYSVMLYPTQAAGTDLMGINPSPKINLKGKGLAINADNPSAALHISPTDSAAILIEQPDDGTQATMTYQAPSGGLLGLRVPSTLTSGNYTLTYPTALPSTSGSPLITDLNGNLSWGTPVAAVTPLWSAGVGSVYPTTLANKVGVGVATPSSMLHIKDANTNINSSQLTIEANSSFGAQSFAALEFRGNANAAGVGPTGRIKSYYVNPGFTSATMTFQTIAGGPAFVDVMSLTDSKVGIGTTTPTTTVDVLSANSTPVNIVGSNAGGAIVDVDALNGTQVGIRFSNAGTRRGGLMYNSSIGALQAFIFGSGANDGIFLKDGTYNVGIGTSNPINKLDVEGGMVVGTSYSGTATAPADGLLVLGNVGIGTTTPGMLAGATNYLTIASTGPYSSGSVASIELKGNTNAGNDAAAKLDFLNGLGISNIARIEARTSSGNTGEGQLVFYTDNGTLNEAMRIDENGLLGIGTNNPTALLSVNGVANKPGGGTWAVFSDARSKENIMNYNKGLNELLKLRPVSFNYKSEFNWGDKTYVGLIAQEVEKVVPTMVEQKEVNGIKDFREVDPNEINYMLINAIKEQQKMIEDLKKEIEALKK